MKTVLNSVVLPTLFNVVNDIVQIIELETCLPYRSLFEFVRKRFCFLNFEVLYIVK